MRLSIGGPMSRALCLLALQLGIMASWVRADYGQVGGTGALEFDGVDDYVTLGNRPSLWLSGDLSVCAWVKLGEGTSGRYMGIAGKMVADGYYGFAIGRHSDNRFYFWIGTESTSYGIRSDEVYTDSQWHHVAGVIRAGASYLYIDGTLVKTAWTGLQIVGSNEYAYVGRLYSDFDGRFFRGSIDEVCFYDRGLAAQEVQSALSIRPSATDDSLAGYWTFDETTGQIVSDRAGKGNDGYLGGTPGTDASDPQRVSFLGTPAMPCQNELSYLLTFDSQTDSARVTSNNQPHSHGGLLHVERITGQPPDTAGVLRMRNLLDVDARSLTYGHVVPALATIASDYRACPGQFSFAVTFDYLFRSQEGVLAVRVLDGTREIRANSVGTPDPDQAGGHRTMTWAQYRWEVTLSYSVPSLAPLALALELRGPPPAEVLINNLGICASRRFPIVFPISVLNPQIRCVMHCADIAGPRTQYSVGPEDYLAALYTCGRRLDPNTDWCVDAEFTQDGVASLEDVEYFDWVDAWPRIRSCGNRPAISMTGAPVVPGVGGSDLGAPLLIAGKAYAYDPHCDEHSFLSDRIFGFGLDCRPVGISRPWAGDRMNTRILKDYKGQLYQLNVTRGLIRLSDGQAVVPCRRFRYGANWVDVGWTEERRSPPIQDAAFDVSGDLYVVPVSVTPDSGATYRVAARIRLGTSPNTNYVVQLYNAEPLFPTGVHEIEVDHLQNVYVLDKRDWLESRLVCYGRDSGAVKAAGSLREPTTFHVSRKDGQIVVAHPSSLSFLDSTDLTVNKVVSIQCLRDNYITAIAEESGTDTLWVAGYAVETRPPVADIQNGAVVAFAPDYRPFLAKVPRSSSGPVQAVLVSDYRVDEVEYLSLPLSIVCTGKDF